MRLSMEMRASHHMCAHTREKKHTHTHTPTNTQRGSREVSQSAVKAKSMEYKAQQTHTSSHSPDTVQNLYRVSQQVWRWSTLHYISNKRCHSHGQNSIAQSRYEPDGQHACFVYGVGRTPTASPPFRNHIIINRHFHHRHRTRNSLLQDQRTHKDLQHTHTHISQYTQMHAHIYTHITARDRIALIIVMRVCVCGASGEYIHKGRCSFEVFSCEGRYAH